VKIAPHAISPRANTLSAGCSRHDCAGVGGSTLADSRDVSSTACTSCEAGWARSYTVDPLALDG
jgi:hypothetical protein